MLDIIGKRKWYYVLSVILLLPGVFSLFMWGVNFGIDFTGGSRMTLTYPQTVNEKTITQIESVFTKNNIEISTVQKSDNSVIIRTKPIDEKQNAALVADLQKANKDVSQEQFETIGPVIGKEITLNALYAIAISSTLIVLYIAWSFRGVRKPVSSWRFGITAIVAMLHDALFVIGVFSLLGHFYGVEVDSLFVTALLTVIGFSVHDTIVVFDRIRENLRRDVEASFPQVVNDSLLQTLVRSLNTSITTMLVLLTLLLFGGDSIRWFVFAMFIGMAIGTYSSIFNAASLLVTWQEWSQNRKHKKLE